MNYKINYKGNSLGVKFLLFILLYSFLGKAETFGGNMVVNDHSKCITHLPQNCAWTKKLATIELQ